MKNIGEFLDFSELTEDYIVAAKRENEIKVWKYFWKSEEQKTIEFNKSVPGVSLLDMTSFSGSKKSESEKQLKIVGGLKSSFNLFSSNSGSPESRRAEDAPTENNSKLKDLKSKDLRSQIKFLQMQLKEQKNHYKEKIKLIKKEYQSKIKSMEEKQKRTKENLKEIFGNIINNFDKFDEKN